MSKNPRKNWFTAMGILFIVAGVIPVITDLFVWGPDFVVDFFTSHDLTHEKVSAAMFGIGGFLIIMGLRVGSYEKR